MHCKICNTQFCWICMGNWADHNSTTGGYYKCNKFVEDSESTKKTANAKSDL